MPNSLDSRFTPSGNCLLIHFQDRGAIPGRWLIAPCYWSRWLVLLCKPVIKACLFLSGAQCDVLVCQEWENTTPLLPPPARSEESCLSVDWGHKPGWNLSVHCQHGKATKCKECLANRATFNIKNGSGNTDWNIHGCLSLLQTMKRGGRTICR